MFKHHNDSIRNITDKLEKDPAVQALLIGGSIAHGFQKASSDVDIMIIVSNDEYANRLESGQIHYYETESCTYDGGYIDGKYLTVDFMEKVAIKGSEPARFAYEGVTIAFSRIDGLASIIDRITRYPADKKTDNIVKFYSQFEAWHWYSHEAIKHGNTYLLQHSITQFILFGGRLILAEAEVLYPYHKWFLEVLERVIDKPDLIMDNINALLNTPTEENIKQFHTSIKSFRDWGIDPHSWPNQFMKDSELNWMDGIIPVADI